MSTLHLILRELWHRKVNFLLSLLAVVTAVALFVGFFTSGIAAQKETARLMRDIGYNLRIIPSETDMTFFYAHGFSDKTMPQGYVDRFAKSKKVSFTHLLATLTQTVDWGDKQAILKGIGTEQSTPGREKPSMIFQVEPGTATLGYELARERKIQRGEEVELLSGTLTVGSVLQEKGDAEDITLYANLADAQRLLERPGQINEIKALDCLCLTRGVDPAEIIRKEVEDILPEAKVVRLREIGEARSNQRLMMNDYFSIVVAFVTIVSAIWIGALAMLNTRERRDEIGVLRALGYGSGKIAGLFLGKAILLGLLGAVLGFWLGQALAETFGPRVFLQTSGSIKPIYSLLGWSIIFAPLFTALSSFIPTMLAITQDPADALHEN